MNESLFEIIKSSDHFTLMKFSTNWRAAFWTPSDRDDIQKMPVGKTAEEAVTKAVIEKMRKQA